MAGFSGLRVLLGYQEEGEEDEDDALSGVMANSNCTPITMKRSQSEASTPGLMGSIALEGSS